MAFFKKKNYYTSVFLKSYVIFVKNGIGDTLFKNTMTGRIFLRAVKALVMVTLSDSFRMWPPLYMVRHDFQFLLPHPRFLADLVGLI